MVDFTLADMIGGEMLFPGETTPGEDRRQRAARMRQLFRDGVAAYLKADMVEAKACFDGMRLVFDIAVSVDGEQKRAEAQAKG